MAAGSFVKRMLLVFLLSVLDYSSAFPRARSSVYPDAWQAVKEKQKEVYVYGSRRPLHYIQALRQTHREPQPNIHVPVQIKAWQKHPGGSLRVHNHAQIQNPPSLYHQTRSPYHLWSNVATKGTQEMSIPQSPLQRNHPLANPRSFEFNLKLPFANFPSQNKDNSSSTKSFDLNSSGSGGAGHDSTYKPSGMHIDSSFKSPSDSDSLDKGSTDEGKNDHEISKPNFQLSLSIPFPPFPKPYSSNDGDLKNSITIPGSNVQNSNMKPEKPQLSSTQSGSDWILLNSASTVQQQPIHDTYESIRTPSQPVPQPQIPSWPIPQPQTPSLPIPQPQAPSRPIPQPQAPSRPIPQPQAPSRPIPQPQAPSRPIVHYQAQSWPIQQPQTPSWPVPQPQAPSQPVSQPQAPSRTIPQPQAPSRTIPQPQAPSRPIPQPQAPSQPAPQHSPQQSDNVHRGYYSGQINPTSTNYGKGQSGQTVSSDPTNVRLSLSQSQQERGPSGHFSSGQVKPIGNSYGQHQIWHPAGTQLTSSSEQQNYGQFQPSLGHVQKVETVHPVNPVQQSSQTAAPSQYLPPSFGYNGEVNTTKTQYTKLLIDVDDMSEDDGQHNSFAASPTHFDEYSGTWTGQDMAETPISNPNPQFQKFHSLVPTGQGHPTTQPNFPFESYLSNKAESHMPVYSQAPSMGGGESQYASVPQKQTETKQIETSDPFPGQANCAPHAGANSGSVPTNFGQQLLSEPTSHTASEAFSPNNRQYYVG